MIECKRLLSQVRMRLKLEPTAARTAFAASPEFAFDDADGSAWP